MSVSPNNLAGAMIVLCNACHANFRVADEKVGPRGVKVRCSRCQTIFVVRRDAIPAPAPAAVAAALLPPPPPPANTLQLELPAEEPGRSGGRSSRRSEPPPLVTVTPDDLLGADPFAARAPNGVAPASGVPASHPERPPPARVAARRDREDRGGAAVSDPAPSGSRLRILIVNFLSVAALLLVTIALLAVWRGEYPNARGFKPRALLSLIGRPAEASAAPLLAIEVTNGVYETAHGPPLLFVRGRVKSSSGTPVGGTRVHVEILDGQRVVGSADGVAGALPTPEDLWSVASRADLEKLTQGVAARASHVRSAHELPFMVIFAEHPPDLSGLEFRVVPAPDG